MTDRQDRRGDRRIERSGGVKVDGWLQQQVRATGRVAARTKVMGNSSTGTRNDSGKVEAPVAVVGALNGHLSSWSGHS